MRPVCQRKIFLPFILLCHIFKIKKNNNLIEWSFEREGLPYFACNERNVLLLNTKIYINFGSV